MIEWVDDPDLPCAYCVGWVEPDPFDMATAYPVRVDGSRIERMYKFTHDECQQAVMDYVAESHDY